MADGSRKGAKTTFHLLAGLGSGVLSAVLLQPIDLLKTRVQQAGHHSLRRVLAELRAAAAAAAHSSSGSSSSHDSSKGSTTRPQPRSLAASLYRGTVPSALRTGLGSALYFAGLNAIRSSASRVPVLSTSTVTATASSVNTPPSSSSSSLVRLSNTGNLLAGAVARAGAGFVLMPLTIIKVRYESSLYAYPSLAAAATDIFRADGLRGFFAGFGATALRDAPYAGLYVLLYEQVKRRLNGWAVASESASARSRGATTTATPLTSSSAAAVNFASGLVAAAACSVVSNPFDAVKTRIQLQPHRYRNMLQTARRMLAEEGPRAMLDGLALRMSRKAMSSALAWTLYEELIRRAERRWP